MVVQPEFGWVVLVAFAMVLVNIWMIRRVGAMRKKFNIRYPTMYSDKHPIFNCHQRAHQNTLEYVPFFYAMLLLAGLRHPLGAAAAGAVFVVGRVIYVLGYSTGDPEKRIPGAILSGLMGMVPLALMALSTGTGLLGWW